ncbi:unnamed protein product [Lactuca virosa]|uniref:Uncharacterized protein n=1 Tax=Lactuca virosa TaxID=75947 RepID=A0AAU9P8Z7_9ASTR|nr:unnamed protein product [Lactuca virosa]
MDEPNKRFVEEEEMINEEDEEPYYHDTQFDYGGLEEKVAPTPTHGEPSQDMGEHDTKIVTPIGRPQRKRAVACKIEENQQDKEGISQSHGSGRG